MIDLKELANNLPPQRIIQLVQNLGADRYIEKDDYIIFPTICHNINAAEAKMKLYYYKSNKKFHCYTDCGDNFNIFTLFKKRYELLGIEYNFYKDIVLVISEGMEITNTNKGFSTTYQSDFDKYNRKETEVNITPIKDTLLNIYTFYPTVEWLNDGISEQAMKDYNIRYSIDENKIIIPHYDYNGNLIGIRGRALNDEDVIIGKYMPVQIEGEIMAHPLGYNVYGLNLVKDNIARMKFAIVAESEKSCLQYSTMFGMDKNVCVAVCGSSFSTYQFDLLLAAGAEKILIAFDKEGKDWNEQQQIYQKRKKICENFKNKAQMGFIWDTKNLLELKDSPFDKGKNTFLELYKGAIWL